ncbi:MAG: hypothetical protein WBO25_11935 [Acidimicrobiia bacterium]
MRSLVQIQVGPRDRLCTSAIKALFPTGSQLGDSFPVAELDATKEALEAAIEDPALTGLCWEYMRGDIGQPVEAVAANEFISGLLSTRSSPSSESASDTAETQGSSSSSPDSILAAHVGSVS